MINRRLLKARGKITFKANYWRCVLVGFLATLISGGISTSAGKQNIDGMVNHSFSTSISDLGPALFVGGISFFVFAFIIIVGVFLINPLSVGCNNFFLSNRRNSNTDINAIERGFTPNYKNTVIVMFMTDLFIFLWSLLFIIPGIVKHYEYYLVEYILSENPDIDYKDAQAMSSQLMSGHKMETFVLELSFIGWLILGAMTCGLLNLFYVNPYMEATKAELYVALAHPMETNAFNVNDYQKPEAQTVEFTVEEIK